MMLRLKSNSDKIFTEKFDFMLNFAQKIMKKITKRLR